MMRYSLKDSDFQILKRAHDALVREWEGVKREFYARKAGFREDQPRWPKGCGEDSGRWCGGAAGQTQIINNARTGISTIDDATDALAGKLAKVIDVLPKGSGPLYGIAVHTAFGLSVRFGNIRGIGVGDVEHTWGGDGRYGSLDSVRTDVILRNDIGEPIAIYDVKTGSARLSPARVQVLREAVAPGSNIPVIEMHIERGLSLKSLRSMRRSRVVRLHSSPILGIN
jgi:hypothetical protein